jgi:hypothetical protein
MPWGYSAPASCARLTRAAGTKQPRTSPTLSRTGAVEALFLLEATLALKAGDAHVVFNGQSRKLKFFVFGEGTPRHVFDCHDVGVNDANIGAGEDVYGHLCKCPPGIGYTLGPPDDEKSPPYGFHFTPINDDPAGDMAAHGRAGIGIHGGGSDLADPFAPRQGFEATFGCLRLANEDNESFVQSVRYIQSHGGTCYLDVVWP